MCRPDNRRNAAGCHRQNVGATLVSPGKPTQRRNWPETPRTPHRAMPRTGRAVPAPGVINGAPTSITARRPSQRRGMPPPKRRGDTCVARKTVATPQLAGNTARTTVATPRNAAAKRRGDTCVARITVATPQLAGNIAYTASRNAADGLCRAGTGRHKWRPYIHHRPNNRRYAAGYRRQNVGATLVSPERPSQRRRIPPPNVGATLVSPG